MFTTLLTASLLTFPAQPAPPADELVQELVDALNDTDFVVRQNLGAALARLGPRSVEPLRAALRGESVFRRAGAAYALGLLGDAARPALPDLLAALKDTDVEVRRHASFALSRVVRPVPPEAPRVINR